VLALGVTDPTDVPEFYIGTSGTACKPNDRLATYEEAKKYQSKICSLAGLGGWDIVNLASGGSFDGAGYECRFRLEDSRGPFDHSVCVKGKQNNTII
jgi:hypothetical protein